MSSLFDKLFPRIKGRPSPETTIEARTPYQPRPNEPQDPVLELLRAEVKSNRVIHTYGYEAELEDFAAYLVKNKNRRSRRETETSNFVSQELKKVEDKPLVTGNPNTMWVYGVGGACIGFALAGALMRKHVEPLTSLVFTSFSGIGGYAGSKMDEMGYLPPLSFLPPPIPQHVPTRSHST